jgi:drug/metabolite transporter (DMT)-like permease
MFSIGKRTLQQLDPFTLGSARYAIGVLLFVVLLIAVEGRQALRYEGRFTPAAIFGLLGIAGFNLFLWIGLMYTRPEHAAIILALQSPMTALMVWAAWKQRPPAFTLACVATAIAGVLLVVTKGDPANAIADLGQGGALFGDVLVFLGGACWAAYTLAASKFAGWSPLRFTTLTCIPGLAGLVVANLAALAVGGAVVPTLSALADVIWQIAYLSVCAVVLGVLGFNNAARRLGPLNTMLMLNIVPVLVFGIEAALGRSFSAIELAGAAVVVASLVANNLYLRGVSTSR